MSDTKTAKGEGNERPSSSNKGSRHGRGYRHNRSRNQHRGDGDAQPYYDNDYRSYGSQRGGYYRKNHAKRPYQRTWSHFPFNEKRKRLQISNRLKETEIGITEYIGDHNGFSGILKQRYADFHVNEIDLDGQMAVLTDQDIPLIDAPDMNHLKASIPESIAELIEAFSVKDAVGGCLKIDVTGFSREERECVHMFVKALPLLESQTVNEDDKKILQISKKKSKNSSGWGRDNRDSWKQRGGDYCHFLLHKVNMDTMDVLNQIADRLRTRRNEFTYAGTKDRRAWTTQWVSIRKVQPVHISRAARSVRGAYVGNFKYAQQPLQLGMLSGNRFRIALRNVTQSDEDIEKAMISLKNNGFINYYGLQRFGTVVSIPTHIIGRALLQGNWEKAVELILKPRDGEMDLDLIEARKIYQETKNALNAFEKIQRRDKIEAILLRGIHENGPKNLQGALDHLPRNARLMYLHAYQSFVWNNMVSRRIREFGHKPIVGDFVYANKDYTEPIQGDNYLNNVEEQKHESLNQPKMMPKIEVGDKTTNLDEEVDEDETRLENQSTNSNSCTNPPHDTKMHDDTEIAGTFVALKVSKDDEVTNESSAIMNESTATTSQTPIDQATNGCLITIDENNETGNKIPTDVVHENQNTTKMDSQVEKVNAEDSGEKVESIDSSSELSDLPEIKILTEDDLPHFTLEDVVMPQPGWRVKYPPYAKTWYDEFLAKDDLTTNLSQKNRKYSLSGGYRKILQIPKDSSWKIMHYKEKDDDFIQSDMHIIQQRPAPKDNPEGTQKALIIEFTLPPSTYATMAIREIMRTDTSPQVQAENFATLNPETDMKESKTDEDDISTSDTHTNPTEQSMGIVKEISLQSINNQDKEKVDIHDTNDNTTEMDVDSINGKKTYDSTDVDLGAAEIIEIDITGIDPLEFCKIANKFHEKPPENTDLVEPEVGDETRGINVLEFCQIADTACEKTSENVEQSSDNSASTICENVNKSLIDEHKAKNSSKNGETDNTIGSIGDIPKNNENSTSGVNAGESNSCVDVKNKESSIKKDNESKNTCDVSTDVEKSETVNVSQESNDC